MYNKKRIMTRAHIFHSSRPDHTFGSMLYYAWYFERDFHNLLASQPVRFTYRKEDGSVREALGTLNTGLIPENKRPKGTWKGKVNYARFPYYDLDRCAWRSFDIRNFIDFVEPLRDTAIPGERDAG